MDTKIKQVEVLPLVKYYMEEPGLARLFDKYVPNSNGADIDPAQPELSVGGNSAGLQLDTVAARAPAPAYCQKNQ